MEDSRTRDLEQLKRLFYLDCGFATRALHAGEHLNQPKGPHPHTNAIYQSSTFVFESAEHGAALFAGKEKGYIYTRLGNPTVLVLEGKINALEGREVKMRDPENVTVSTVIFASGMSAISSTCFALLEQGDTMIRGDVLYGCTDDLFTHTLPRFGIDVVTVDTSDLELFERVMKEHPTAKVVYFETPTNPTMKVTDIAEVVRIAKSVNPGVRVVIDNTFATPYLQRPLALGADVVVHSTTKYICGHGTVVGGAVCTTDEEFKNRLYTVMKDVGPVPSPFDAWLVNMGIKTLPLRMERHCSNAMQIARFLEAHPAVEKVYYPGLESFEYHEIAKKQMDDFGGMISFELKGGYEAGKKLMDHVHVFTLAVSLGSVDSLIQHPASMTHACVAPEIRRKVGITDGLVRISVGIEDVQDLIRDLEQGLARL